MAVNPVSQTFIDALNAFIAAQAKAGVPAAFMSAHLELAAIALQNTPPAPTPAPAPKES
jgi:hypothetical protein